MKWLKRPAVQPLELLANYLDVQKMLVVERKCFERGAGHPNRLVGGHREEASQYVSFAEATRIVEVD